MTFNFIYFIVLLFQTTNCNFIFDNINFGVEGNLVKNIHPKEIIFNNLIDNVNFETKMEPMFEPTNEPTIELTLEPIILIPSLEPTLEPTLDPTIETITGPTFEPTLALTLHPTNPKKDIRYKILEFYVDIQLDNFEKSELDDNDKEILLYVFGEITEINREYLSIKNKNLRLRKLFLIDLDYFTLQETIMISIPLIDNYKVYEENPYELYNSLVLLITASMNTTLFQDILQDLNYSSFSNIQVKLVKISDPEIRTVVNKDNDNSNDIHITDYKLTLILVFGILGIIIVLFFYYKVYPKIYNYRRIQIDKKQQKNKVYSVNELVSEDSIEIQKDVPEESRIVEITNEETKL